MEYPGNNIFVQRESNQPLSSVAMNHDEKSYGVMLWGQGEDVHAQCASAKKRVKAVMQYLKTIKAEEDHHASALAKALSQLSFDGTGSFPDAISGLRSQVEEEGRVRTTFSKAIQELIDRLKAFGKSHEKSAHSLHTKEVQEAAQFEAKLSLLHKSKGHYHHCCRVEDQLRANLAIPEIDPKLQASLQLQLDKAVENKLSAKEQYEVNLIEHEKAHREHIEAVRSMLNEYQTLENELTTLLKETLLHLFSQRETFLSSMSSITCNMSSSAQSIDPKLDTQKFMTDHSRSLAPDPPPSFEEYYSDAAAAKKGNSAMKVLTNLKLSTLNATRSASSITRKMGAKKKRKDGTEGEDDVMSPRDRPLSPSLEMYSAEGDGNGGREEERGRDSEEPVYAVQRAMSPPVPSRRTSTRRTPSVRLLHDVPLSSSAQNFSPYPPEPVESISSPISSAHASLRALSPSPLSPSPLSPAPPPRAPRRMPAPPSDAAQWGKATALYENVGQGEGELTLSAGQEVFVIREDDSGWWLGACECDVGFFPGEGEVERDEEISLRKHTCLLTSFSGNYVEYLSCPPTPVRGIAVSSFNGEMETDLTLQEGEEVYVISYQDKWYTAQSTAGRRGIVPSMYVRLVH